jgi:hypothetical protein
MNPIVPENTARVFTIGHSNRSLADFLELLAGIPAGRAGRRPPLPAEQAAIRSSTANRSSTRWPA